jgi:hypothetical protein
LNGGSYINLSSTDRYAQVTGLTNGTTYTTSIEAENANGWGPAAYFRDFQPGSAKPGAPSTIAVSVTNSTSAVISWTPPSNANTLDAPIQWYAINAIPNTGSTLKYTADAATQSSYYMDNLVNPYNYTYNIYAVNCPGWGPVRTGSPNLPGSAIWATKIASPGNDIYQYIKTDSAGNIYMVGQYASNPLTISNYTSAPVSGGAVGISTYGTLENAGGTDIFLVKYNSSGTAQWATRIAGTSGDAEPCVTTDSDGNVYVCGNYSSSPITISSYNSAPVAGGAVGISTYGTLANAGVNDVFLVKYNSSGVVQWATKIGGSTNEIYSFIETDTLGNVYLASLITSTTLTISNYSSAPSGGGAVGLTTYGTLTGSTNTLCLIKYNSSGTAQWATTVTASLLVRDIGLATDSNNNVYFTGRYPSTGCTISSYNSAPVAGGAVGLSTYGTLTSVGLQDICLVKYNSSGVAQWATRLGSTNLDSKSKVATDSAGNVYITGSYAASPVTISNYNSAPSGGGAIGIVTYGTLTLSGTTDVFLVKYNSSGTAQWATKISGTGSDFEPSIAVDSNSNIYISCTSIGTPGSTFFNYSSPPSGGGAVGLTTYGTVASDIKLAVGKYNSSGVVQWATTIGLGGGTAPQAFSSLAVDRSDNLYVAAPYYAGVACIISNYSTAPVAGGNVGLTTYGTLPAPTSSDYDICFVRYST